MASLRKAHHTWIACLTLPDGKRTERSTRQRDLGLPTERAEAKRKALLIAQNFEDALRGNKTEAQIRKTVTELCAKVLKKDVEFSKCDVFLNGWLTSLEAGFKREANSQSDTYDRYRGVIRKFLAHLGDRKSLPLADITALDVQGFIDASRRSNLKSRTIRTESKILHRAFSRALKQGLVGFNPVGGAELPDEAGESKQPFTDEQVKKIFGSASGDWKTCVHFGCYGGARLRDCANVTWAEIDLVKRTWTYAPKKTRKHKKMVVCPLHPSLLSHLLTLPSSDSPNSPLMPMLAGRTTGGRSGLSAEFNALLKNAGIENEFVTQGSGKGRGFKAFGFHSFRHTFKSGLINRGVAVETADVLVGHAKKTVSETYIHRSLALLEDAVKRLPAY